MGEEVSETGVVRGQPERLKLGSRGETPSLIYLRGGLCTIGSHIATVTERGSDTTMVTVTPM